MRYRSFGLATTALLGTLAGGLLWLTTTESGLHAASRLAASASDGRLQITASSGSLLGSLDLASLRWTSPDLDLRAEKIHLDWSPGALLHGRLQVAELSIGRLRLEIVGSDEKTPPPSAQKWPFPAWKLAMPSRPTILPATSATMASTTACRTSRRAAATRA